MLIRSKIGCFLKKSSDQIIKQSNKSKSNQNKNSKKGNIEICYNDVMAQFTTPQCDNLKEFIINISNGIFVLETEINPCKIDLTAAKIVDLQTLEEANNIDFYEEEYDAYALKINNESKNVFKTSSIRTTTGNINIETTKEEFLLDPITKTLFVYMLDLFLGTVSTAIERDLTQIDRRKILGKAGACRLKNNGIDYAVLSSWWIDTPENTALVYLITEFVYYAMIEKIWEKFWTVKIDNKINYNCFGYNVENIKNTINFCNKKEAEKLLNFIYNFMPNDLVQKINDIKKSASYANYIRG